MFVVFGVTGHTGKVVANTLLGKGKRVRVVVRDAKKGEEWQRRGAEVAVAHVEDAAAVERALAGAEGAYLLQPPDAQTTELLARGRRIVDAYKRAIPASRVKHVVYLSSIGAQHPTGTGPIQSLYPAEHELPAAAPDTRFTFVRAAYFMENLAGYLPLMQAQGVLPAWGGGEGYPFPMVATADIGETAAEALLSPPSVHTQIIELSGPAEYSFVDAARAFSAALGRTVTATPMPLEAMVPALQQVGFSADVAASYREMSEAAQKGLMAWEGGAARAVRGKVTLDELARRVAGT